MCAMNDKDRELLQHLDALLADKNVNIDRIADDDLKSTAKFIKIFAAMRIHPDESYKNRLKEKLLRQMEERKLKEKEINRMIIEGYTTRRPSWRLALFLILIIAGVLIYLAWQFDLFNRL